MSDVKGQDRTSRGTLSLTRGSKLDVKKNNEGAVVRQSFSHGRSKSVAVEVKKTRGGAPAPSARLAGGAGGATARQAEGGTQQTGRQGGRQDQRGGGRKPTVHRQLTESERQSRARALLGAQKAEEESKRREAENARQAEEQARRRAEEEAAETERREEEVKRQAEEEAQREAEEAKRKADVETRRQAEEEAAKTLAAEQPTPGKAAAAPAPAAEVPSPPSAKPDAKTVRPTVARRSAAEGEEEERGKKSKGKGKIAARTDTGGRTAREDNRARGKIVYRGDEDEEGARGRSLAAMRRRNERAKQQQKSTLSSEQNIVREVVLPETIVVQDLAERMAVRGADVVKQLMKMGVMATVNQTLDADTAEIVIEEMGHTVKRVAESDVEIGLEGEDDTDANLNVRAPVVTIMGHVDHGKTSLLDALREANVVAREAGGITQHIGAYQIKHNDQPVTFIDTPGHAAFTQMRARGAQVTDIVVLVVAADDGVMPQTVEAIRHAQAAGVPIIVAVNKIDKPEANPDRVLNELLNYEVVTENFGGDVQSVRVSALKRTNLEGLLEVIQLQSELMELTANPDRAAQAAVVEARLDRGRGVVATVLVQKGTLHVGDICVCGQYWGRVRALVDDKGEQVDEAGPAKPVEVLGLDGTPDAGDLLIAVESEKRAREIADYRQRKRREQTTTVSRPGSLEDIFGQIQAGQVSELPVVVKTDVHGSLEAIQAGVDKLGTDEVKARVLHGGVGAITESDVTLAMASQAIIIGFNVRANAQARELAKRDDVEIRYYSVIYELLDEIKNVLTGMLAPSQQENIIGHAEIREVFAISKIGKIAGCRVVDGIARRGCRVRLLRDNVVIHEGELDSLRRFKDDVKEVRDGFECGIGLANYNDIKEGDVIEFFEMQEVARTLDD